MTRKLTLNLPLLSAAIDSVTEARSAIAIARITSQGLRESHVHDVMITEEAPNYRAE